MNRKLSVFALVAITLGVAFAQPAWSDFQLNMPVGVTTSSVEIYGLHMLVLWVCVAIGIIVYTAMVLAIVRFRKSSGAKAASWSHNTAIEVVWTVIPAVILVALAVPSAESLVRLEDTRDSELTVLVTGSQWQWRYDYIDHGVGFYSALDSESNITRQRGSGRDPFDVENYLLEVNEPMVVPVDTKVRLLVTAADVLHAWWVPDFGVKKDAIPGYVNETWFEATEEGTFRGQCAELCGMDHAFMPVVVRVTSREAYETWLAEKQAEDAQRITRTD